MNMRSPLRAVADSKHEGIQTVWPSDLVSDAIGTMKARNIGAVIVLDDDDELAGIFTERDLLTRVAGEGLDSKVTRVSEVMTPDPQCVEASTTVEEAMRMVTEQRIRHLPLVTGRRVEGLISSGDLTAWVVTAQKAEIEGLSQKLGTALTKNKILVALTIGFVIIAIVAVLTS